MKQTPNDIEKMLTTKQDPVISPGLDKQLRTQRTAFCIIQIMKGHTVDELAADLEKEFGIALEDGRMMKMLNLVYADLTKKQAYAVAEKPYVTYMIEDVPMHLIG